jgi:hypothetical protein
MVLMWLVGCLSAWIIEQFRCLEADLLHPSEHRATGQRSLPYVIGYHVSGGICIID